MNTAENITPIQPTQQKKKLNLGCGNMILPEYVNVDLYNPLADVKADVLKLPFDAKSFSHVLLSHVIEHVSYRKHIKLLEGIHKVLEDNGEFTVCYPDFELCATAFLENKNGERWRWWVQTLYGMQTDAGQYHVAPVTRDHLTQQLFEVGFGEVKHEVNGCDVVTTCRKKKPMNWF